MEAKGIVSSLQKQIQLEVEKNKAILERILDVTFFLASRNLAFRGTTENVGDVHNGNFLGTLELLARYDPLLSEHLKKVSEKKKGSRMAHYLSSESQNELIELCGEKVLKEILKERENAIYYSVICDATPDISHVEQNVILLRYIAMKEDNQWEIIERFLQFKAFNGKTGQEISEIILKTLEDHGIAISDCRGQGFDNGANMSGKVKGVQAEIKKINPLATYSPCASHSLNLVGVQAAESCPDVSTFFGCLNRLYSLFSASPERWAILKSKTGCSIQRLSETRWSARIAAVKPVANHLPSIIEALDTILAKCSLTNEARSDASGLKQYFMSFKAIVLLTVWKKILQSIEDRNLILQSGKISMEVEISNIQALKEEMEVCVTHGIIFLQKPPSLRKLWMCPGGFQSATREGESGLQMKVRVQRTLISKRQRKIDFETMFSLWHWII